MTAIRIPAPLEDSALLSALSAKERARHNNVLDYGAVGDGVADDTTAVQDAITAGNEIYLPPGTYLVKELTLGVGKSLRGAGRDKTILKLKANSNTTGSTWVLRNGGAGAYNTTITDESTWGVGFTLQDLTIDPNRKNQSQSFGSAAGDVIGIRLKNIKKVLIERVRLISGMDDGNNNISRGGALTAHHGVAEVVIRNCIGEAYVNWEHNLITLYSKMRDVLIEGCLFEAFEDTGYPAAGLGLRQNTGMAFIQLGNSNNPEQDGRGILIRNNIFRSGDDLRIWHDTDDTWHTDCVDALRFHGPATGTSRFGRSQIIGNTFRRLTKGVKIMEGNRAMVVADNLFDEITDGGVHNNRDQTNAAQGISITGNTFLRGGYNDILLHHTDGAVIAGNAFVDSGQNYRLESSPTIYLIRLNGVTQSSLSGNVFRSPTADVNAAVRIENGVFNSSGVLLVGNNADTAGLSDSAGAATDGGNVWAGVSTMGSSGISLGGVRARDFDGVDDRISYPNVANLAASAWTFSCWCFADVTTGSSGRYLWVVQNSGNTGAGQGVFTSTTQDGSLRLFHGRATTNLQRNSVADVLTAGRWHHVVCTYDNSETHAGAHIYVDGAEVEYFGPNNTDGSGTFTAGTGLWVIGARTVGDDRQFDGGIYEPAVWNRALSSTEIAQVRARGCRSVATGLLFAPDLLRGVNDPISGNTGTPVGTSVIDFPRILA